MKNLALYLLIEIISGQAVDQVASLRKRGRAVAANGAPKEKQDHAIAAMGHWVSAIADNIRNPVAGISAALEVLSYQLELVQGERQNPKQTSNAARFDLDIAESAIIRMKGRLSSLNEYLTELVDFAKPVDLYPKILSPQRIFSSITSYVKALFPFAIDLEFAVDPSIVTFEADEYRLTQVLKAIIVNGIEASCLKSDMTHHPVVQTTMQKVVVGGRQMWEFAVEDNGPGFKPDTLARALEPFFSTKEAGTGLGLFLAQKYVTAHGGCLTLGQGINFKGARVVLMIPTAIKR